MSRLPRGCSSHGEVETPLQAVTQRGGTEGDEGWGMWRGKAGEKCVLLLLAGSEPGQPGGSAAAPAGGAVPLRRQWKCQFLSREENEVEN